MPPVKDHPGAIPGWNLALRFVLELAAFAGVAWAGWHLAAGFLGVVLAVLFVVVAAVAWGTFAVVGDPSRGGKAPVVVPGWVRLALELAVFAAGALGFAIFGAPVVGLVMGVLVLVHLAFSLGRTRWLLRQRPSR